jgi:anti-sigma B factor antagonist
VDRWLVTAPDGPFAGPRLLSIERPRDAKGVITLVLRGEIDVASAVELDLALIESLSTGPSGIVIDLAGVDFIDSTGLRTLMVAQDRAASNGHSLILRHVGPQARRLFELSGTADAFVTE